MPMATDLDTDRQWTLEEYHATSEFNARVDLVEGQLRVMAPPRPIHNRVAFRLQVAIDAASPATWQVDYGVGVLLSDHPKKPTEVMPDLTIFSSNHDLRRSPILPEEVLLVVEVVSPSSQRKDRFEYPRYYARAGIPHYWRVDTPATGPQVRIVTHRLVGRVYAETGEFAGELKVEEPFPMAFDVASLIQ
jgi:Uma2 family endonuclease